MRKSGCSLDWDRAFFTMDEVRSTHTHTISVDEAFIMYTHSRKCIGASHKYVWWILMCLNKNLMLPQFTTFHHRSVPQRKKKKKKCLWFGVGIEERVKWAAFCVQL